MDGLFEADIDPDPLSQFDRWFREAKAGGAPQPDAMALATATLDGRPSVRMVLLKGYDQRGLVFYSNLGSQKGTELQDNPRAAVAFYWFELHRQVRISGTVTPVTREETERYFRTRPRDAQISALASRQSRTVADRAAMERAVAAAEAKHQGEEVPLPEDWNGLRLVPESFEFWQGRPNRLHDRLRYTPDGSGGWRIERLQP
jgi:pyridoxamine 5'-phosphate oxidase